jgi:hypothetical protein
MIDSSNLPFVHKHNYKNGSLKFHFIDNEIYNVLKSLGFRFVRINRKPFFYRIISQTQIRVLDHFTELDDEFSRYLKELDLSKEEHSALLNTFYRKNPIRRNGLAEHYLKESDNPGPWLISEIYKQTV